MTTNNLQRVTIQAIQRRYTELHPDGHWFDKGAKRFFWSRLAAYGWRNNETCNYFFVSSERFDMNHPRLYSVRVLRMTDGHGIDTIGEFQAYSTLREAQRACMQAAQADTLARVTDEPR